MEERKELAFLKKRRSIRKYTQEKIDRDTLLALVEAGMYAPSAINQQPWHFVIMDDPAVYKQIPNIQPHSSMTPQAAAVILVAADRRRMKASDEFWPQDLAAATENILLAADALGLGAVWLAVYPKEPIMRGLTVLCQLPPYIVPFSLISLGYPAEERRQSDRFREELVDFNIWREKP